MNWLHYSIPVCSILIAALIGMTLHRSHKYRDKGMLDPWRPYLYTGLILVILLDCVAFILRTSHK
jgi:hypothetical protein